MSSRRQRHHDEQRRRNRRRNFIAAIFLLSFLGLLIFLRPYFEQEPESKIFISACYVNYDAAKKNRFATRIPFAEETCAGVIEAFGSSLGAEPTNEGSPQEFDSSESQLEPPDGLDQHAVHIVYLNAHIAIRDKELWLLYPAPDESDTDYEEIKFAEWLGGSESVGNRIIFLDCGHAGSNYVFPGSTSNGFEVDLVNDVVAALGSNTHLIVSHSKNEMSFVSNAVKKSLFGLAIINSAQQNSELDVQALFKDIQSRTKSYSSNFDDEAIQNPIYWSDSQSKLALRFITRISSEEFKANFTLGREFRSVSYADWLDYLDASPFELQAALEEHLLSDTQFAKTREDLLANSKYDSGLPSNLSENEMKSDEVKSIRRGLFQVSIGLRLLNLMKLFGDGERRDAKRLLENFVLSESLNGLDDDWLQKSKFNSSDTAPLKNSLAKFNKNIDLAEILKDLSRELGEKELSLVQAELLRKSIILCKLWISMNGENEAYASIQKEIDDKIDEVGTTVAWADAVPRNVSKAEKVEWPTGPFLEPTGQTPDFVYRATLATQGTRSTVLFQDSVSKKGVAPSIQKPDPARLTLQQKSPAKELFAGETQIRVLDVGVEDFSVAKSGDLDGIEVSLWANGEKIGFKKPISDSTSFELRLKSSKIPDQAREVQFKLTATAGDQSDSCNITVVVRPESRITIVAERDFGANHSQTKEPMIPLGSSMQEDPKPLTLWPYPNIKSNFAFNIGNAGEQMLGKLVLYEVDREMLNVGPMAIGDRAGDAKTFLKSLAVFASSRLEETEWLSKIAESQELTINSGDGEHDPIRWTQKTGKPANEPEAQQAKSEDLNGVLMLVFQRTKKAESENELLPSAWYQLIDLNIAEPIDFETLNKRDADRRPGNNIKLRAAINHNLGDGFLFDDGFLNRVPASIEEKAAEIYTISSLTRQWKTEKFNLKALTDDQNLGGRILANNEKRMVLLNLFGVPRITSWQMNDVAANESLEFADSAVGLVFHSTDEQIVFPETASFVSAKKLAGYEFSAPRTETVFVNSNEELKVDLYLPGLALSNKISDYWYSWNNGKEDLPYANNRMCKLQVGNEKLKAWIGTKPHQVTLNNLKDGSRLEIGRGGNTLGAWEFKTRFNAAASDFDIFDKDEITISARGQRTSEQESNYSRNLKGERVRFNFSKIGDYPIKTDTVQIKVEGGKPIPKNTYFQNGSLPQEKEFELADLIADASLNDKVIKIVGEDIFGESQVLGELLVDVHVERTRPKPKKTKPEIIERVVLKLVAPEGKKFATDAIFDSLLINGHPIPFGDHDTSLNKVGTVKAWKTSNKHKNAITIDGLLPGKYEIQFKAKIKYEHVRNQNVTITETVVFDHKKTVVKVTSPE